jgi:hypothetical protein
MEFSYDYDVYGMNSCNYTWKRNGAVVNDTDNDRYTIKSLATYDYCDNFENTKHVIEELNASISNYERDYYLNKKRIKCFTSVLTIDKMTKDDFGDYECSIGSKWDTADTLTLTVFNADATSEEQFRKRVIYFEKALRKGLDSKVLMQCVVESGSVYWFFRFNSGIELKLLDSNTTIAGWRCFDNFREISHKFGDSTESFIFFDNVCLFDEVEIYCGADSGGTMISKGKLLSSKTTYEDPNYYSTWKFDNEMIDHIAIVVPTLVISFFTVASVLACCRLGLCCDCSCEELSSCCRKTAPGYNQIVSLAYTATSNTVCPATSQSLNNPSPNTPVSPPGYAP